MGVLRQVANRSPNGIKPEDIVTPLFVRVSLYFLFGVGLTGVGGWLLRGSMVTVKNTQGTTN